MTTETVLETILVFGYVLQLAFTCLGAYAGFKGRFDKAAYYISFAVLMFLVARD